jgi:hypothetical protein
MLLLLPLIAAAAAAAVRCCTTERANMEPVSPGPVLLPARTAPKGRLCRPLPAPLAPAATASPPSAAASTGRGGPITSTSMGRTNMPCLGFAIKYVTLSTQPSWPLLWALVSSTPTKVPGLKCTAPTCRMRPVWALLLSPPPPLKSRTSAPSSNVLDARASLLSCISRSIFLPQTRSQLLDSACHFFDFFFFVCLRTVTRRHHGVRHSYTHVSEFCRPL